MGVIGVGAGDNPREMELLMPLNGIVVFLMEEKLALKFALFPMVRHRHQVLERDPVGDAEHDEGPADGRRRVPRDVAAGGSSQAVGRWEPSGDDGEGVGNGEDQGCDDADDGVHLGACQGFLRPFAGARGSKEQKAETEEEAEEGVDDIAVFAYKHVVR